MPNWVKNQVRVRGKLDAFKKAHFPGTDEQKVRKMLSDEEAQEFDFNTIIPMPKHIFQGDLGEKERLKYGVNNWYDWSIQNWGTKWNACDIGIIESKKDSMYFTFNTAWATPEPIYRKLAEMYPDLVFEIRFADEDIGRNCGVILIRDGKCEITMREDSDFANEVWGE